MEGFTTAGFPRAALVPGVGSPAPEAPDLGLGRLSDLRKVGHPLVWLQPDDQAMRRRRMDFKDTHNGPTLGV